MSEAHCTVLSTVISKKGGLGVENIEWLSCPGAQTERKHGRDGKDIM